MNRFSFDTLKLGEKVSFEYTITEEKMQMFKMISDDINPLHNDLSFAMKKGFSEKVVYGMLTSSALSTLAGVYLPGENSLIHTVEIKFLKPVFLSNGPLIVKGQVIEKDERFSQITVKYEILDQKNVKVCRGIMKIGFLD